LLSHVIYTFTREVEVGDRLWAGASSVFFVVAAFAGLAIQEDSQ
jgi:hypothetical protein